MIEEVVPQTNMVNPSGRKYVIDCNENVEISPVIESGQEYLHESDGRIFAYNLTPDKHYGYDLTINFSDFDLDLFAFISNGVYRREGTEISNLMAQGSEIGNPEAPVYDTQAGWTDAILENTRRWFIQGAEEGTPMTDAQVRLRSPIRGGALRPMYVEDGYIGLSFNYRTTGSNWPDLVATSRRKYIRFDATRQIDQQMTDFVEQISNRYGDDENAPSTDPNYYFRSMVAGHYLEALTPDADGSTIRSRRAFTTSYVIQSPNNNGITGFYQFGIMKGQSWMVVAGGTTYPAISGEGRWRVRSVIGVTFNFMCVLESSNYVIPYNKDPNEPPYDMARFYHEMRQLPVSFGADRILESTYLYITLNPNARRNMRQFYQGDPRGATYFTNNVTYAADNYQRIMDMVDNDVSVVLFDNLLNLRPFFVGTGTTMEPDHLNKSWVLRRQVRFDTEDAIKLSYFVIFMPTSNANNPWVAPTDTTPPVLRNGIPLVSTCFNTLVPAVVPYTEQGYVHRTYSGNEENKYLTDMQRYVGEGQGDVFENVEYGGMKSEHSSIRVNPRLFKTTLYTERFDGTSPVGYYKLDFPLCHAEPSNITINGTEFSSHIATIHARDDFINYKSAIYINPVDTLEEVRPQSFRFSPSIDQRDEPKEIEETEITENESEV